MASLEDKIALITGAGKKSGIGYAIAKKFASLGANVVIADFGTAKNFGADVGTSTTEEMDVIARELAEEFGVQTLAVNLDVTNTR